MDVSEGLGTPRPRWTFLTNHAHVLLCLAQDPDVRLAEVARRVGITERAAQSILADLVAAGYVTRHRVGRRNAYELHPEQPLRHQLERDRSVGELLQAVGGVDLGDKGSGPARSRR
jgi:predicted transcriptional regulator